MRNEEQTLEEEEQGCDAFSVEKIFGIATLGAVTSLGLYFLYQNLGDEAKDTIKDSVVSGFKAALHLRD